MVNENNSIVSNGAVFSYFLTVNSDLFSAFFFSSQLQCDCKLRDVKCQFILCNLCGFVPSVRPAVKKVQVE